MPSPFACSWFHDFVHIPPDCELLAGRDHSVAFSITPDLQGTWSKVSDFGDEVGGNPFLILTS